MKKIFLLSFLVLLPLAASADDSGKCGENVYYSYDSTTHTLTIYGEGRMYSHDDLEYFPWVLNGYDIRYIIIEHGVSSIGNSAFYGRSGLTSIQIPSSVTIISNYSFYECSGLTSINIPNSLTSIGMAAFYGCTSLKSITIPSNVKFIEMGAFGRCSSLTSINVEPNNNIYDSRDNCNAIIETKTNTLIFGCKSTIIPNDVTSIGSSAFDGCSSLISITIPNSVTSIERYAFNNCSGLTSVTIPNSVTSIGEYAFRGCSALTSVISEIENPFEIDNSVFDGIPSSAQLIVPKGTKDKYQTTAGWNHITNIVEVGGVGYAFEADGINYRISEDNIVCVTYKKAGYSGDVVIPSSVVYQGNTYRVTSIESAFYGCYGLTSITIPSSVTSIGTFAFCESGLTSITIPNSVTSIGFEAFKACGLTSVTIPSSVALIGPGAFSECYSLATVVSEMENPCEIVYDAFSYINANATLIVPPGTKSAYQSKAGWNLFTNIIEAGGEEEPDLPGQIHISDIYYKVTESGEAEVMSVEKEKKCVSIPSTISHNNSSYKVTSIAKEVFQDCEHLAAVIWEPEVQFNAKVSNPNFLLYVKEEKYASRTVKNVVVNNVAESIELTDASGENDFYCPRAFTAKKISYSHHYNMETGLGDSKGWETIVLPFDVQNYTHATKGEIESFTTWTMGSNKKPFWLFELTASGYKDVASIKANTPYIISMPNNRQYEQQYQIPGVVTFSAENVEVKASDSMQPARYQDRTFVPNYTNKTDDNCFALNVNNYYVTNSSTEKDGSKFIKGLRSIRPFEAYMTTTSNTRSINVLDGMTTAIKEIMMVSEDTNTIKVYDTKGVLVKITKTNDDLKRGLANGVYIVNGKKMIIK